MSRPWRLTSSSRSRCSGGVFDWEPALRRLDELNARVEDPTLWDRPDDAQAVMRDRTKLASAVEAVRMLERETGIPSMTLHRFLGQYRKLLDGNASRADAAAAAKKPKITGRPCASERVSSAS